MTKKPVFAFEKCTGVWLTLIHFLSLPTNSCCQWTVAKWQPICRNIFDVRPETYHRYCESHRIIIVSIIPRRTKVLSLRPQQKIFYFAGSVVGPDSPWSFWSTGFLWRNLPETFLSSFSSIPTSKNLLETSARWNNRWDQGKLTEGEGSVQLTSSFG